MRVVALLRPMLGGGGRGVGGGVVGGGWVGGWVGGAFYFAFFFSLMGAGNEATMAQTTSPTRVFMFEMRAMSVALATGWPHLLLACRHQASTSHK